MGKVGSNRMIFPNVLDMVITNTVLLVSPLTFWQFITLIKRMKNKPLLVIKYWGYHGQKANRRRKNLQ